MDKVIYLIYPALAVLLLAGAKVNKKGQYNEDFLSLSQTKALQGFVGVLILLHHLSQKVSAHWIDPKYYKPGMEGFIDIGYLCVSVFLFCSGYGLFVSYKTKENYINGFFAKRVLPIIVAFYTSEIIYLIARIALGEKMDAKLLIEYIIGIRQTNPNIWYCISLPLFYLFFYLAFKLCKTDTLAVIVTWILILAYMIIGTFIDHNDYLMCGEWWYNSVHLFPFGMLFAKNKDRIIDAIKRHYGLFLVLSAVLTAIFFVLAVAFTFIFSYYYGEGDFNMTPLWETVWRRWACLGMQMLASLSFVMFTVILRMKLKIQNRVLDFLGGITLEFYIIHGLFVHMFCFSFANVTKPLYYIKYPPLYVLVVTVLSLLATFPYKKLNEMIIRAIGSHRGQTP